MGHYEKVIRKNNRPFLQSIRDDINARKDKDFFWYTGTQVYVGTQGSGKTISAVKHILDVKNRYPKAIVVSNVELTGLQKRTFDTIDDVKALLRNLIPEKEYIFFHDADTLATALTQVNNGKFGVIYLVDEIHTYFNAINSKDIPMYLFTEISQQRKQRKLIIGTSQLFLRMAKPLREQCDSLIICRTLFSAFTIQKVYDGMSLTQEYDGTLIGDMKKIGWFFHNRKIRNAFDTYQKVVSSASQLEFEQISQPIRFTDRKGKNMKFK